MDTWFCRMIVGVAFSAMMCHVPLVLLKLREDPGSIWVIGFAKIRGGFGLLHRCGQPTPSVLTATAIEQEQICSASHATGDHVPGGTCRLPLRMAVVVVWCTVFPPIYYEYCCVCLALRASQLSTTRRWTCIRSASWFEGAPCPQTLAIAQGSSYHRGRFLQLWFRIWQHYRCVSFVGPTRPSCPISSHANKHQARKPQHKT